MSQLESMLNAVRPRLLLSVAGSEDPWLVEHTQRVAQLVGYLCPAPELAEDPPDETAALLAACAANIGWADEVRAGGLQAGMVLNRPTNEAQRSVAIQALPELARDLVSREVVQLAQEAIRQSPIRDTGTPEAQVLAEAESLADMGVPYVMRQLRRYANEGRTVSDFIASWNRQHEYHFWDARINDGLRFEQSRQLARQRLEAARTCVAEMERQLTGADLPPAEGKA